MSGEEFLREINDIDNKIIEESNNYMKKKNFALKYVGVAAALVIAVGAFAIWGSASDLQKNGVSIDLTTRIVYDENAVMGSVMVNIEGVITEVSDDGMSFKLDNGKWVDVVDDTEIGITGPTAAKEQFFEPTFRVGNMIAGFTENENAARITAYAIYTNWNWEDPIR